MHRTANKLRLTGHGRRLRVRTNGDWSDPLDGVAECCRASLALDKTLAEAIRRARDAGCSWAEIGRTLGAAEDARSGAEVSAALAGNRQMVWGLMLAMDDGAE